MTIGLLNHPASNLSPVHGTCRDAFAAVRDTFTDNLNSSRDIGASVAVFVDGPVHDHAAQALRDADAEERLIDCGWSVIRIRHDDDWGSVAAKFPSVFGPSRSLS